MDAGTLAQSARATAAKPSSLMHVRSSPCDRIHGRLVGLARRSLVSAEMVGDLVGELQCRHAGRWDEKLGLTHGADSDVVELGAAAGLRHLDNCQLSVDRDHEFHRLFVRVLFIGRCD